MAGKRGSRYHSTMSFSENVVVAETSCQMLQVLSFCDQERVQPPSLKVTVLTFVVKNGKMKLSGESTVASRKVVGKSACDNPERHCGWF